MIWSLARKSVLCQQRFVQVLFLSVLVCDFSIMELPITSVSACELRSVIRFFTAKNLSASKILQELVSVYGESCMSIAMVCRWRDSFVSGRDNVHDEKRSGRPASVTGDKTNVVAIREIVEEDRRLSLDEISEKLPPSFQLSRASLQRILTENLGYRKVCARWVPRVLTTAHKDARLEAARCFFQLLDDEGDELYSRIVTGDETWVHHSTPETKQQSMAWTPPGEKAPQKAKRGLSAGKIMATVFWDAKGVLLVEYLPRGQTINAERYSETLLKLKTRIKRKRPGLLTDQVLLMHDNARPHSAATTQTLLQKFKWDIFPHPPYSPDLAPSDFYLFPKLKSHLGGQKFETDEEVQNAVNGWLQNQDEEFYAAGIQKLAQRYQKCIDKGGSHVEK